MARRVAITGIGLVTSIGAGREEVWRNLVNGKNGIERIVGFDTSGLPIKIAGQVRDFDFEGYIDGFLRRGTCRKLDRFTRLGVSAAKMAFDDSRLRFSEVDPYRIGCMIGTTGGSFIELSSAEDVRDNPRFVKRLFSNSINSFFKIKGPFLFMLNSCPAGAMAVGEGFRKIQYDEIDVAMVGAAEAPLFPNIIKGLEYFDMISYQDSPTASRPFDLKRDGMVLAEAGAFLILEELGSAVKRGARIYAEIRGYSLISEFQGVRYIIKRRLSDGFIKVISASLNDAGIGPGDVDYINAYGNSTWVSDRIETDAVKSVFQEKAYRTPISSIKGGLGNAISVSGALDAAATALAVGDGILPPTLHLEHADPDCDLDYVPNTSRRESIGHAISTSFGMTGTYACLAFRKYEQ